MNQDDYNRRTSPNPTRAGIALTWRNLAGVRPQTAQRVNRDRCAAELREMLKTRPDIKPYNVAQHFGLKTNKTTIAYLALARGEVQP